MTQQHFSVDPWLRVRGTLRDGSVLELSVVDRRRTRKLVVRNYRGKTKWKTKTKFTQRLTAQLSLPPGREPARPREPAAGWLRVAAKRGKRLRIRATAQILHDDYGDHELDRLLLVAAEPTRWAAPAPRRRGGPSGGPSGGTVSR